MRRFLRVQAYVKQGFAPEVVEVSNKNAFLMRGCFNVDASEDEILDKFGSKYRYLGVGYGLGEVGISRLERELPE